MSAETPAVVHSREQEWVPLLNLAAPEVFEVMLGSPLGTATKSETPAGETTFTSRYLQSLSSTQGQFQTADSALSSVIAELTRALTLAVQGANGTQSDAGRAAIAAELQGIQDQLVSLGNTSFQGTPLFAGTQTGSPPFVKDNTFPSGVRYDGNDATNNVQIGDGYRIAANKPGSQLFVCPRTRAASYKPCSPIAASIRQSPRCAIPSTLSPASASSMATP
jgi:hypothetical protein